VLEKPEVRVIMRRIVLPTALAGIVFWATPAEHEKLPLALPVALATFLVSSFVIGSRFGWWFEGYVIEQFAPTWHVLSRQWLPGLFRFISRVFSTMMEGFQRAMYRIDDLLRFRRSRSFGLLVVAAGAGTLWAAAAYVIRFYMTLLVEPEINPLKHFPVVTVAHKILLPFLPDLENAFEAPLSIMGPIVGASIAWVTAFLLPSVFGFLAWELKENYRLYQATRSERIQSARFGPSGETMRSLLVAGIHSGTLPKLYERLRRSAQRREELSGGLLRKAVQAVPAAEDPAYAQFREGLGAIERALYRFVERELLPPIAASRRWIMGYVAVSRIDLSSNRIRIQLSCPAAGPEACDLTLEQLGGRIVAGMAKPGFVTELSKDQALLFENALAVFYHRCEIDLVREQIEAELGGAAQYDVNEDGLCVWPDDSYQTELVYDLDAQRPRSLIPAVQGARLARPARVLDSRRIVFHQQTISWAAWENAWAAANHETEPIPRILLGPSLLSPQRGQDARASAARLQLKSYASLQ
jgi:hypothetical protein